MPFHLRRATPDDAAAVRVLVRAAYAKWVPIIGREPRPMTADYDHAVRNHIVDLLFVDDGLAAVIEMVVEPECVLIENVAVRPDQAGRGHGHALMAHAVEVARSIGRKRLRLYTNRLMAENIALYQRLGYATDREETTPDGRQIIHMSVLFDLGPPG
jgi:N-acetylglutamate synthase-like GNAT family acetyltransferase